MAPTNFQYILRVLNTNVRGAGVRADDLRVGRCVRNVY